MLDVTALSRASTAFSVLEFVNILGMLTQIFLILGLKVKAYGSARIHKVIGVKIVFKRADYAVFFFRRGSPQATEQTSFRYRGGG